MPTARKDQIFWQPGSYYHIYNRGAHGRSIFREETNYHYALQKIKIYCREFQLGVIAYCLMPNHYHLLIRQDGEWTAGLLPQRVFNSYSKAYNKMYAHSGTLFESRYHSRSVQDEPYLLHLCRYIHANPARDRLVERPEYWPYSNYLEWIGEREGTLIDRAFISGCFPDPREYAAFVHEYLDMRQMPEALKYLEDW